MKKMRTLLDILAVGVLAALAACSSVIGVIAPAGGTGGFAQIDSAFSDAPVSPGGTGGTAAPDVADGGEKTQSFFTAFQIDPVSEHTAGPKFVTSADIDGDGLPDLVSAWNESQPIQLHLQRRGEAGNIFFRSITLAGTTPIAIVAGVEVGFINDDPYPDIVVLVKATGYTTVCPAPPPEPGEEPEPPTVIGIMDGYIIVLFNPGPQNVADGASWTEMLIPVSNMLPGLDAVSASAAATRPEFGGYTALAVGQIDGIPGDDIVVALNVAECETLGQKPPVNEISLYANPGGALSQNGNAWTKIPISLDMPQVSDLLLLDVDGDGDLDVVSAWTNSISQNVRWTRNPLINPGGFEGVAAVHQGVTAWEHRPIGTVATGANILAAGDVDGDGFVDIVVRSTTGQIIQWFRRPGDLVIQPEFPAGGPAPDRMDFPWQVFTLHAFDRQEPEAIALGDITGDGVLNLIVAAEGQILWLDGTVRDTIYDAWTPHKIISDGPTEQTDPSQTPGASQPPAQPGGGSTPGQAPPTAPAGTVDVSTHINRLLLVDLDGDGRMDVVGTLDRRSGSGLTNDRLVWYRNTRTATGQ